MRLLEEAGLSDEPAEYAFPRCLASCSQEGTLSPSIRAEAAWQRLSMFERGGEWWDGERMMNLGRC